MSCQHSKADALFLVTSAVAVRYVALVSDWPAAARAKSNAESKTRIEGMAKEGDGVVQKICAQ